MENLRRKLTNAQKNIAHLQQQATLVVNTALDKEVRALVRKFSTRHGSTRLFHGYFTQVPSDIFRLSLSH